MFPEAGGVPSMQKRGVTNPKNNVGSHYTPGRDPVRVGARRRRAVLADRARAELCAIGARRDPEVDDDGVAERAVSGVVVRGPEPLRPVIIVVVVI